MVLDKIVEQFRLQNGGAPKNGGTPSKWLLILLRKLLQFRVLEERGARSMGVRLAIYVHWEHLVLR
jgi:hypothetical protein